MSDLSSHSFLGGKRFHAAFSEKFSIIPQSLKQISYQSLIFPVTDRHCLDELVHCGFILASDLYENSMKK